MIFWICYVNQAITTKVVIVNRSFLEDMIMIEIYFRKILDNQVKFEQ